MLKRTSLLLLCAGGLFAQSYFIKGPDNPKPYEKTAMQELTDYLARRIDGTLTIDGKSPITFQVGDTELAKANGISSSEQPEEKWFIKSVGDQVILNGGGTRGALYATYHFLEDFCGVHWWNDFEDYVPKASSLELDKLDASGKPAFIYRDLYRVYSANPRTSIRNRLNRCGSVPVNAELGGSYSFGPPDFCHTFDRYFPAEKYLSTNPEWFSLCNGKRIGGQGLGQLCLTNPELKPLFLESLLKNIQAGDEAAAKNGVPAPKIYDVSMNDNSACCECPECKAQAEKYGQSGICLNFVNWIAREVKKTRPDIYISTLAYLHMEPPPKGGVRADDNVIVRLCDTQTNQAMSILSAQNAKYANFVRQWKDCAKNLFIWDYAITYTKDVTGMPFASEFYYGDLYKYYYENNVTGIFWEHEQPHMADLYELKFFVECKLFEDPSLDVNKLIDTFLKCYYGAAAPFILEYRKALDTAMKANNGYISWFPSLGDFLYIKDDDIVKCQKIFDDAEAAVAGDKVLFERVRHARCGLDRFTCSRGGSAAPYHGTKGKKVDERLDIAGAKQRQMESWPEWCRHFPYGEKLAEEAKASINNLAKPAMKMFPVPEEFKDRNCYDFCASLLEIKDKNPKNMYLVKDEDSKIGEAIKTEVEGSHYYLPPYMVGYWCCNPTGDLLKTEFGAVQEPGYHWYNAGTIKKMPAYGFLYMNRSWTIQLGTGYEGIIGNEFEVWVSIKFTGPLFRPGDTAPDCVYVDRVLFVEPQEKK